MKKILVLFFLSAVTVLCNADDVALPINTGSFNLKHCAIVTTAATGIVAGSIWGIDAIVQSYKQHAQEIEDGTFLEHNKYKIVATAASLIIGPILYYNRAKIVNPIIDYANKKINNYVIQFISAKLQNLKFVG